MTNLKKTLTVDNKEYQIYSLQNANKNFGLKNLNKLPKCLKILVENVLRNGKNPDEVKKCIQTIDKKDVCEINYFPARILMQDFTGVPAVTDLASLREIVAKKGLDPKSITPQIPVDLIIDHSSNVDFYGDNSCFDKNVDIEYSKNKERYAFLKWAQLAFDNFNVIPPQTGIIHQINLEYLAKVVWTKETSDGKKLLFPDTLVGTDSHTTMINGLSVLGWGVGGIEAEASMLGQPITMLVPDVVGLKLTGELSDRVTATDLVLKVVEVLRQKGVVGKFVEFFGAGVQNLTLADRSILANMAPEYGATCGFFAIDQKTLDYLKFTGRSDHQVNLVEAYAKEQGLWASDDEPLFSNIVEIDLTSIVPSIAGPKRPQDRIALSNSPKAFENSLKEIYNVSTFPNVKIEGEEYSLTHGNVVIAAITSCTNTTNPALLISAGLLAKNAYKKGLKSKPWVKTSLAPGSKVVTEYLKSAELQGYLDLQGFNLVGYGCSTCIGNSGPLAPNISNAIKEGDLVACSVLSGNRNFEGRINPLTKANYLASPTLVVAFALAGSVNFDFETEPLGTDSSGNDIFLKDIWPSNKEIREIEDKYLTSNMFKETYSDISKGCHRWQAIEVDEQTTYNWIDSSTYIKNPPLFDNSLINIKDRDFDIKQANILLILGDSVTTDHISPAGNIAKNGPAGIYLKERDVSESNFNSYGSRRGNHEVMKRGTFANIRLKNAMVPGIEGGFTKHIPTGKNMTVFDAALKYSQSQQPLVIFGGKEYGTGSSRDWAAKGTTLLGVKAVIATSFERIHRSNLIGMGVMPLQFPSDVDVKSLELNGTELVSIELNNQLGINENVVMLIERENGDSESIALLSRLDTLLEIDYYKQGGILQYVLNTNI